ncbi:hypothetical protein UJ101_00566 [Flavobacteriaceae bacterium UJ101]|nr:hypothetical protein UJ101_00566 [Flavobacteriaceae bacterium UJ101]
MKFLLLLLFFPHFSFTQELFFQENFDQMTFGNSFNHNWVVKNIEGKNSWRISSHKNSKTKLYAKISGYKGSEKEEDWLILKQDLTHCYNASLQFETATGFYQHHGLSVWIHDSENISQGEKIDSIKLASEENIKAYSFSPFVSSQRINVSAFCGGMFYLGFRYLGNNSNESTVFELDNIQIWINE